MTTVITAVDPAFTDAKFGPFTILKQTKQDIDATLNLLESREPKDTGMMSDLVTLSNDIVAIANVWQTTDMDQLRTKARGFQEKYESYRVQIPVISGLAISTGQNILAMLLAFSVLFGGIIGSHFFIQASALQRFYYFVYGAALFPFTLLFAIYQPPLWRATLIPLVEGSRGLFSFVAPSPLDKPSNTLRYLSVGLLLSVVGFYYFLYERLPF